MRIHLALHAFFPTSRGGTEQYTLHLARALEGAGHKVTLLVPQPASAPQPASTPPGPDGAVAAREDVYEGLRVVRLGFDPSRAANPILEEYANPRVARFLEGFWASERPDLLHLIHPGLISTAPLEVAARRGIPAVATLTDMWAICPVGTLLRHDGALCPGPEDLGHCVRCLVTMGPRGRAYAPWARRVPRALWRALAAAGALPGPLARRAPYLGWVGALRARAPPSARGSWGRRS